MQTCYIIIVYIYIKPVLQQENGRSKCKKEQRYEEQNRDGCDATA